MVTDGGMETDLTGVAAGTGRGAGRRRPAASRG